MQQSKILITDEVIQAATERHKGQGMSYACECILREALGLPRLATPKERQTVAAINQRNKAKENKQNGK